MSGLIFYNSKGDKVFVDSEYGNKQDIEITIMSPTEIKYPCNFQLFIDSVKAQKKLQNTLGCALNIIFNKTEYKTIEGVTFVSLEIRLEVGQGKMQKNILVPFICPIDLVLADKIIQEINQN